MAKQHINYIELAILSYQTAHLVESEFMRGCIKISRALQPRTLLVLGSRRLITTPASFRGKQEDNRFAVLLSQQWQRRPFSAEMKREVSPEHLKKMNKLYNRAPISGLFNDHHIDFSVDGSTTIRFTPREGHCHSMGSLHGSGYFKMLDDAAFFAAQALDEDNFIYTTSFTTYLVRAAAVGVPLVARGSVVSAGKTLQIASATLVEEETGNLVATGSGTFLKSPHKIND